MKQRIGQAAITASILAALTVSAAMVAALLFLAVEVST